MKVLERRCQKNWKEVISRINKNPRQFHMIKSNEKVILKTRQIYFFHRKPQKQKIANFFFKIFFKKILKIFSSLGKSHSAKKTEVACYRRNNRLRVSSKMGYDESKLSFFRTLRIYSALAILEPQYYVVVEQFGAEYISLLSGRLFQRPLVKPATFSL